MKEQRTRMVRGGCPHDCPATCAWQVTVEDGVAVHLNSDPDHPFTRGGLCATVNQYLERVYSPDRVLYPLAEHHCQEWPTPHAAARVPHGQQAHHPDRIHSDSIPRTSSFGEVRPTLSTSRSADGAMTTRISL